jgi:NAD+ diphosphatase
VSAAGPLLVSLSTPVLARSGHERIAHRRADEVWLDAAWRADTSRVLVLDAEGRAPLAPDGNLAYQRPSEVGEDGIRILLGASGANDYFALVASGADGSLPADAHAGAEPSRRVGLREAAVSLSDLDVGLFTTALALQEWHSRHQHCPRCGAPTRPDQAGWVRRCVLDDSLHFPRTDPAVIMLVHDRAGRCILGRAASWPPGRFSVLAGFVEPGESAEAAVVREVQEEVGIQVRDVHYLASQPHPFPASLMLGYVASLDSDDPAGSALRIDGVEIAEAAWFSRAEVRAVFDGGDWTSGPAQGQSPAFRALPPPMSIARQLIEAWLRSG